MNILIVFVLLAVLMISDSCGDGPVNHVWLRAFAILATLLAVPAFAAFQTALATRKLRAQDTAEDKIQRMLTRLTVCHSCVWLASSLSVVYLLQWSRIVRDNWQLDRFPVLDEIVIIAPIVLSLIGSWFIFFDIQNVFRRSEGRVDFGRYHSSRFFRRASCCKGFGSSDADGPDHRTFVVAGLFPVHDVVGLEDQFAGTIGNGKQATEVLYRMPNERRPDSTMEHGRLDYQCRSGWCPTLFLRLAIFAGGI